MSKLLALFAVICLSPTTWGQEPTPAATQSTTGVKAAPLRIDSVRKVDPGNMYSRVYARVRMIGSGTAADPKRPMFVPAPGQAASVTAATIHTGILAYQMQVSDDGKWALCEFVGATPKDLEVITTASAADVKFFVRGQASLADVLADFSQYKKNFTFQTFTARPQ